MREQSIYKVGVIGCGKIAQVRHLPEYAARSDVRIAGVYDKNPQRAEAIAAQYGARSYASYEELLRDPGIDAVSVCTANNSHADITIAALEAGKHVLCEKPMALSLYDCSKMVETAKRAGRYLLIDHNQRFLKTHQEAKRLLKEGAIGRLISFETHFTHAGPETWSVDAGKNVWFFDKNQAVFGAMADLGIHKIDLIRYLTGDEITGVQAFFDTLDKKDSQGNPISVDDHAVCYMKLAGGATGTVTAAWTNYGREDNSTVLYGETGVIRIFCDREYSLVIDRKDGACIQYKLDCIQTNDSQTKSGIIDEFIDSISCGRESVISGEEALKSMEAVFTAIDSSDQQKYMETFVESNG